MSTSLISRRIVVAESLLREMHETLQAGLKAAAEIADSVGEFRSALDMTREAFAREVGMTESTVGAIENGARNLHTHEAVGIADFLISQAKSINDGDGPLFAAEEVTLGDPEADSNIYEAPYVEVALGTEEASDV